MVTTAPTATLAAVICEDDAVVAAALIATLKGLYGFDVVAAVASGDDVVAAASRTRPAVVVVDLALAGEAGLGIVPALREVAPGCAVVVLVPRPFGRLRASAEEVGAMALVELSDLRALRRCLEQVHRRAHADACPSCPAARPAATSASSVIGRSHIRTEGQTRLVRLGIEPGTGRPPSSPSGHG